MKEVCVCVVWEGVGNVRLKAKKNQEKNWSLWEFTEQTLAQRQQMLRIIQVCRGTFWAGDRDFEAKSPILIHLGF